MATIRELDSEWRRTLLPAHFDNCPFHVESGSRDSGRRIVAHEFPKREQDYAEDMGKRAIAFTVRGYFVVYPHQDPLLVDNAASLLYRKNYLIGRDRLQARLETGGAGALQLPTMAPIKVKCQRYRLTEEEKFGGYCVFDMQFVEAGVQPFMQPDSKEDLILASLSLQKQVSEIWAAERATNFQRLLAVHKKLGLPPPRPSR